MEKPSRHRQSLPLSRSWWKSPASAEEEFLSPLGSRQHGGPVAESHRMGSPTLSLAWTALVELLLEQSALRKTSGYRVSWPSARLKSMTGLKPRAESTIRAFHTSRKAGSG